MKSEEKDNKRVGRVVVEPMSGDDCVALDAGTGKNETTPRHKSTRRYWIGVGCCCWALRGSTRK